MNEEKVLNLALNILSIIMTLKGFHLLFIVFILLITPLILIIPIPLLILLTTITPPTPLTLQMILLLTTLLLKMIPIINLHLAKFDLQFILHLIQEQYSSQQLLINLQASLSFSI